MFTKQEEETILTLHNMLGNKWSQIAQHLPGRTDNEIKNLWHSYLKKRGGKSQQMEPHKQIHSATTSSDTMDSSLSLQRLATQGTHNINFTKEAINQGFMPKLLFAEWLSVDHVNDGNSSNSYDSLTLRNAFDQNPTFQEASMQHCLSEGLFGGGEYHNSVTHISATEMFNSQLKFENQIVANGFVQCIAGVDLSSNFSLSNDAMYV
ncbi:hypothetical protein TanjilG_02079 [Lupinus angustifolius]|nr:hypothetical protein TanjilG_02079 [Lupinus angustifolius]